MSPLLSLNCIEWTFTKWASRYWARRWKHKEDGDSFSPVCNDMAIWLSYSCPREETNMSRRKGLFYLNSVKAKKSRWKGRKTASLITGMVKSGIWALACFRVSSLFLLLRSLGCSVTQWGLVFPTLTKTIKTIPYRHANRPAWARQSYTETPLPGDLLHSVKLTVERNIIRN